MNDVILTDKTFQAPFPEIKKHKHPVASVEHQNMEPCVFHTLMVIYDGYCCPIVIQCDWVGNILSFRK